jgi:NAD(P)-dependent dehydrogenase (short-subunit alcohol dehydrogenase family)
MARDLTGKVIVITGASSGIGAATAVECAEAGMDVVLNARRADRLEQVAALVQGCGRGAAIVAGDVREPGISARMLETAADRFGRFDVVFANAGYGIEKPMARVEASELREIFEVNFFAAVELLREAAARLMRQKRGGHLLMCSSCISKFTLPWFGAYCATKAAQGHVCRAMRLELRPYGIEVASVHPITTTTEFFEAAAAASGLEPRHAELPRHAPRLFVQPPQRVARAVVRCLRRPRPEVWTSHVVRTVAGVMTMFPRFMDWAVGREAAHRLQGESLSEGGEPASRR